MFLHVMEWASLSKFSFFVVFDDGCVSAASCCLCFGSMEFLSRLLTAPLVYSFAELSACAVCSLEPIAVYTCTCTSIIRSPSQLYIFSAENLFLSLQPSSLELPALQVRADVLLLFNPLYVPCKLDSIFMSHFQGKRPGRRCLLVSLFILCFQYCP